MNSWRDQVLNEFTPKVARLTLVADPDGLLLEEGILEGIRERGFELIPFEDHIAFRFAYESRFRSRWDRGEHTDLVVALHSQIYDLSSLPYDLLQAGRSLSFNLGEIFPSLSYPVVAELDRGDLDTLYKAQQRNAPGHLGDNATKEFILRHVFEIASELVKQDSDLLRLLLRRHYRAQRVPKALDDRLIQILRQNDIFEEWPLESIISDREAFLAFLQERWPIFLDRLAVENEQEVRDGNRPFGMRFPGPMDLPFDHDDVRVYVDNLFVEGLLKSVTHDHAHDLAKNWTSIGIRIDPSEDRLRRLRRLVESIGKSVPEANARYGEWLRFARAWAELTAVTHDVGDSFSILPEIRDLQTQVDAAFTDWLLRKYAGLANLPPVPPVMLHHLARVLARQVAEDSTSKVALVVIDGLALDQWIVMRDALAEQRRDLRFREQAIFAWIPTITSVSRQSIFAGKAPIFFPSSIFSTDKEPALWTQFWVDRGLVADEVAHVRSLGEGNFDILEDALSKPRLRVAGLVIDKIDKIMHGMEMGTAGMHNQVRQWSQQPYMASFLDILMDRGFSIYLTSDHGNTEAKGCGRPSEGAIADLRGERVRIYSDPLLRSRIKDEFPSALEWQPGGLPSDYLPLFAPNRKAFVREGVKLVAHGGPSIEETIVPWIQIERVVT